MHNSHFIKSAELCLANGERLLYDADFVNFADHPAGTTFALATIAQEEFAKAFLLFLTARGVVVWNSLVYRATRDHKCKQLLGLVLDHLSPDWDEEIKRSQEFRAEIEEHKRLLDAYRNCSESSERDQIWKKIEAIGEKLNSLPQSVADAIFILRHEKIGRWESSTWFWEEEPTYDPIAKGLSDGRLDRQKQDALYVRLGRDGQVARTPTQVKHDDAKAAMERAERMRYFAKYLLGQKQAGLEYEKIESAFKTAFASLSEKDKQQMAP